MKGGNSDNNRSDFDKSNILKEEGHKAFKDYRANLEELFLSHCEVT
jgi:uncharacterized protein YpiB (UPF0302 family)